MKVWAVVTGRELPFGWNADEFDLVAIYDNGEAAQRHEAAINATHPAIYERADVEVWDVLTVYDETAARPEPVALPRAAAVSPAASTAGSTE